MLNMFFNIALTIGAFRIVVVYDFQSNNALSLPSISIEIVV